MLASLPHQDMGGLQFTGHVSFLKTWQLKGLNAYLSFYCCLLRSVTLIKTYLVKQYSYQNDFNGVFDALNCFLIYNL